MRTVGWAKGLIKLNLYASRDGAQPTKYFLGKQILPSLVPEVLVGRMNQKLSKR
ncbi:MAG: hypothetical protein ABSF90_10030 [Syntrophobacteraceae bacterium]|jgi:hypothetical protein